MANKNLHEKPFDEATLLKLEIFEQYLTAWLPTFCTLTLMVKLKFGIFLQGRDMMLTAVRVALLGFYKL